LEKKRIDTRRVVYKKIHGHRPGDFFPEKLICERVELIREKKEDVLLDELAEVLSGEEKKNEFVVLDTELDMDIAEVEEDMQAFTDIKGVMV